MRPDVRWTRLWTAVVALRCVARPADAAIRVLAFPRTRDARPAQVTRDGGGGERPPEAPDLAACLMAMSYTCLQRKTVVYLDAVNRLSSIPVLGGFVTAVRTRPVDGRAPAISERLLDARGFDDVVSLSVLVDSVVRSIVREHALRISFPWIATLAGDEDYSAPPTR